MGLNIGGIYVKASNKDITQKSVADFIEGYWLNLGAKISRKDLSKLFEPLKIKETGLLGFRIFPPTKNQKGEPWIGVYDSEHYHGDPELVKAMAINFKTEVWDYVIAEITDAGWGAKYNSKGEVFVTNDLNEVLENIESLLDFKVDKSIRLAFESIPYRPNKNYSGPDPSAPKPKKKPEEEVEVLF